MGLFIGTLISLAFIAFIANALVEGYTEGNNIPKWIKMLCKVTLSIIFIGILAIMAKCGSSEHEHTPSGETTLEHYEPR